MISACSFETSIGIRDHRCCIKLAVRLRGKNVGMLERRWSAHVIQEKNMLVAV